MNNSKFQRSRAVAGVQNPPANKDDLIRETNKLITTVKKSSAEIYQETRLDTTLRTSHWDVNPPPGARMEDDSGDSEYEDVSTDIKY